MCCVKLHQLCQYRQEEGGGGHIGHDLRDQGGDCRDTQSNGRDGQTAQTKQLPS